MLEAAEAAEGESPGSSLDAVPVDVDAGAEVARADALVVEETHGAGCVGGWRLEFRVLMVVLVLVIAVAGGAVTGLTG